MFKLISYKTQHGSQVYRLNHEPYNVYLISDGEKFILVDTGRKGARKHLEKTLEYLGVESIEALILTHAHYDHAENAAFIKERYHAKVLIHRSEAEYLSEGKNAAIKGAIFFTRIMTTVFKKRIRKMFNYQPVVPDIVFDDELLPGFIRSEIRIIHTPGHTEGSSSVIVDNEWAIVGDCMSFMPPMGRVFPPFAENPQAVMKSWGVLLGTPVHNFLPGHGKEISRAVLMKKYLKIKDRY